MDEPISISVQDSSGNTKQETVSLDMLELWNYSLMQRRRVMELLRSPLSVYPSDFTKENIFRWLEMPHKFEKRLRDASIYMYNVDGHYRRLCNYQPDMVEFSHIIVPLRKTSQPAKPSEYKEAYENVAYEVDTMNLKAEGDKLLRVANREGVAYGYCFNASEGFYIMVLDPDFCRISGLDTFGCIRFEFDFSYFKKLPEATREAMLEAYGDEFISKYDAYKNSKACKWQEISERGICIKANEDELRHSIPPFVSVLDSLFDLQDYKGMAKAKEEAGNYNLLTFTIPTKDGKIQMDLALAKKFIEQASSELPNTIGILYSPMEMEKISFSKPSATTETNAVTEAEQQFWGASGVSELLFGTSKSSANALAKSIIADETGIFPLVRQIERWINRKLRRRRGNYKFKVKILDVTAFNKADTFDRYLKAGNAGIPVKNALAASLGFSPYEVLAMAELENDILDMRNTVYGQPLLSSTQIASTTESSDEGGRPESNADDLTPEGEATRVNERNIRE